MRIVHVIDYFQPELGYQEYYLAREQLALGHDVHVVCSDRYYPFPDYDRTIKPLLGDRIRPVSRGMECGVPVWRLPIAFERGRRALLRHLDTALGELRPEVVHAHNIVKLHTFQVAARKARHGYRLLVDEHAHGVSINQRWTGRWFYAGFRQTAAPLFGASPGCLRRNYRRDGSSHSRAVRSAQRTFARGGVGGGRPAFSKGRNGAAATPPTMGCDGG